MNSNVLLLVATLLAPRPVPQGQPVEFEVASIRPSLPIPQTAAGRQVAGAVTLSEGQVRGSSLTLRDYVSLAHGVPPERI